MNAARAPRLAAQLGALPDAARAVAQQRPGVAGLLAHGRARLHLRQPALGTLLIACVPSIGPLVHVGPGTGVMAKAELAFRHGA